MIKWFKQNEVLQLVVIIVTTSLLWLPSLLHPTPMQTGHEFAPLYSLLYGWLGDQPRAAVIVALVMVVVEGFLLNLTLYNHKMVSSNTLMPMWIYILAMSLVPAQLTLTPMVVANLLLLGMMSAMMVKEDLSITLDDIFNASMMVAMAALCYTPAAMLMIALFAIFTIHKLYNWRDWVMMLLGFLAPFIVAATVYYLCDRLYYVSYLTRMNLSDLHIAFGKANALTWVVNGLTLMTVLLALTSSNAGEKILMHQRNHAVISMMLLGGVLMLLYSHLLPANPQTIALPTAYMASGMLLGARRRLWIYNLLIVVFLILAVVARFL